MLRSDTIALTFRLILTILTVATVSLLLGSGNHTICGRPGLSNLDDTERTTIEMNLPGTSI